MQTLSLLERCVQEAPLLSSILCSTLVGLAILIYHNNKNTFAYWQRKGIKGPKPWPIVGNFVQLLLGDRMEREREWARQYGKLYGLYQGAKPRLVVADAEILQQICVKDFEALPNHDVNEFFNHYQKSFLFFLQDDRWKRTRAIMSPTFTSGKIKRMFRFLDACADDLVSCFEEQLELAARARDEQPGGLERSRARAEVNVKDIYNLFTMDAIATCCYGLKLERVAGSADLTSAATRNDFVRMAMKIFDFSALRLTLLVCVPKSFLRFCGFKLASSDKYDNMATVVRQLVGQRRAKSRERERERQTNNNTNNKAYDDYLQLLIDARLDDEMELDEMDSQENHHAGLTCESLRQDQKQLASGRAADDSQAAASSSRTGRQQALSELEIVSGAMFLLVVGLETTSSLLAHCTYLLAFNPEVQEKLHDQIERIAELKGDKTRTLFSYEALTSCQYLDSVISETLRLFTSVLVSDRVLSRDYYIEKYNLRLPKGSQLTTALHAIMNDPDYWPEPEKFDPERFMPGNRERIVPGSYCPFGIGPRHCIGMRFSLTETKLALAKTIMRFRFEPAPGTRFPPELKLSFGLINMKRPNVLVSLR